jgi:hypothetical protein
LGATSLHRPAIAAPLPPVSPADVPPKYKISKGSVSIPPQLRSRGQSRARDLGLSFSRYLTLLLQNDLRAPDLPLPILTPKKLTPAEATRANVNQ